MKAVKTILFVENDPVSLTMYQNRLQREGFYIETAQDGLTALRTLSQSTPDLVVLDLMLPRLSGGEVFKIMRADRRLINTPIVIFSNAAMTEWPQDVNAGTTRCLPKSESTFPMLLQAIQEMLAAAPVNDAPIGAENLPSAKPDSRNDAIANLAATPNSSAPAGTRPSPAPKERTEFLQSALSEIPKLRELCLAYIKAPTAETSQQDSSTLQQRILFFHTSANQSGCARIALLTNVFGALLSEILAKPSWATTSALQTMAQAVDCLRLLLNSSEPNAVQPSTKAKVLAVDDDPVCNHVIVTTLRRANFDPITIESPVTALELLRNGQFDLVLLDVNMPEMTGFQLCEKLRRIPHCKTIPVVFVTAFNNFDNRKQSVLSGGNDFITKPISPLELALKVTIHMLKSQLQPASTPPVEIADAPKEPLRTSPTIPIVASIPARNGAIESPRPEPQPAASSPTRNEIPLPPLEQVPARQIERFEMVETVSASALEPTTESQTTDATQAETPESAPATPELVPTNTSDGAFQPAGSIPAPQLDPALVASLASASAPGTPAELPASNGEAEYSLTTAPAEALGQEETQPIPSASIPRDMFQPAPADTALPASSLIPSTESGTDDAESLMAAAAAALAEALDSSINSATSATAPNSTAEFPAEPTATDAPAFASTSASESVMASNEAPATPAPDFTAQPEPSLQLSSAEASIPVGEPSPVTAPKPTAAEPTAMEIVGTSDTALQTSQLEPAAAEPASPPADSLSATPLEPAPTETSAPVEILATPVADTIAFESERTTTSSASLPASEPIKAETPEPAVQSDLFSTPKPAAPAPISAPAASEIQKHSMQTQISQTAFERICIEVAKLIFGENGATELNLRLVRAALERANIHQMINGPTDLSC